MIQTLADIKRACTVGRRLTLTYHVRPEGWRNPEIQQAIRAGAYTRRIITAKSTEIARRARYVFHSCVWYGLYDVPDRTGGSLDHAR